MLEYLGSALDMTLTHDVISSFLILKTIQEFKCVIIFNAVFQHDSQLNISTVVQKHTSLTAYTMSWKITLREIGPQCIRITLLDSDFSFMY